MPLAVGLGRRCFTPPCLYQLGSSTVPFVSPTLSLQHPPKSAFARRLPLGPPPLFCVPSTRIDDHRIRYLNSLCVMLSCLPPSIKGGPHGHRAGWYVKITCKGSSQTNLLSEQTFIVSNMTDEVAQEKDSWHRTPKIPFQSRG